MGTKEEYVRVLNSQTNMALSGESEKFQQYLSALIASMGAAVIGATLAWTSPMFPIMEDFNSTSPVHSVEAENAWVASLAPVGAVVGALPAGIIANAIGRKTTMIAFTIPWILTSILILLAQNVTVLYVARFLGGVIIGIISTLAPMYVAEIAEPSIRGSLGSYFQLFMTIGILYTYSFGALESYSCLSAALVALTAVYLVGLLFIPESHVYLVRKGKITSAEKSLRRLRGPNYNTQQEIGELRKALEESSRQKFNFGTLFKRANLKAMIIAFGVMIIQQASGINAVIFFAGTIFTQAGSSLSSNVSSISLGVVQVIFTFLSGFLMDRAGRKILLLISIVVMGVCLGVLGSVFYLKEHGADVSSYGWIPLSSLLLFIVVFSIGLGPIPWMLAGEMFSPEIKGFASGVAVSLNWIQTFLVTRFFRQLTIVIGGGFTFWIFTVVCVIGMLFVLLIVPETKGKSLQEIQDLLAGRRGGKASSNNNNARKYEMN